MNHLVSLELIPNSCHALANLAILKKGTRRIDLAPKLGVVSPLCELSVHGVRDSRYSDRAVV